MPLCNAAVCIPRSCVRACVDRTDQGFIGPDGPNHVANSFEPIANCPESMTATGNNVDLYSQAWLGAIQAAMYDLVIFTGPQNEGVMSTTATIAGAACILHCTYACLSPIYLYPQQFTFTRDIFVCWFHFFFFFFSVFFI